MIGDRFFIFFSLVIMLLMMGVSLYQHELAHETFNTKFGIESEWIYEWDRIGIRSYGEQPETLKLMHGINEAVSYNLAPLVSGIMLIIFCGFLYIGMKIDYYFSQAQIVDVKGGDKK